MDIKIKVAPDRFDEIFSIEDWLHIDQLKPSEIYDYMAQFVVDAKGQPVPPDEAHKLFKKVPKRDFSKYIDAFIQAIKDAYVNPTSGTGSDSVSKPTEPSPLPDGSAS